MKTSQGGIARVVHKFYDNGGFPVAMSHAGDTSAGDKGGSLAAYQRAYNLGFRYFQVDIVPVGGDELVSAHAITGRKRGWEDRSAAQLAEEHEGLVALPDLFDALPGARWNIELKSVKARKPLIKLLHSRSDVVGKFAISSPFNRRTLEALRNEFSDSLCTAASLTEGGLFGVPLIPIRTQHADAVQVLSWFVRSDRIIAARQREGIQFQVWPVNKPASMRRLLSRGAGGIITDNHQGLIDVLSERGQWAA